MRHLTFRAVHLARALREEDHAAPIHITTIDPLPAARALHSDAAGDGSPESRRLVHALLIRTAPDVWVFFRAGRKTRRRARGCLNRLCPVDMIICWMCRAYGGPELTSPEFLTVIEELSRADGSVGWCAMVASVWSRLTGYIAEGAGRQIFDRNNRLRAALTRLGRPSPFPEDFASPGAGVTAASSSIASGRSATLSCMTARPGASTIAERRISGS